MIWKFNIDNDREFNQEKNEQIEDISDIENDDDVKVRENKIWIHAMVNNLEFNHRYEKRLR